MESSGSAGREREGRAPWKEQGMVDNPGRCWECSRNVGQEREVSGQSQHTPILLCPQWAGQRLANRQHADMQAQWD